MGEHPIEIKNSSLEIVRSLRHTFRTGKTIPINYRIEQLKALLKMCEDEEEEMVKASEEDVRRGRHETMLMDIAVVTMEIKYTLKYLRNWVEPEKPPKEITTLLDSPYIMHDPYGVVLIMGAWNYPFQTMLKPLCGAIAGGNCVVLKPSEIAPATAKFFSDYIPKYLDEDVVKVFLGGVPETTNLLKQKFDYIFFTGSERVGRIIHAAANKYLVPTTLELGGKCPVYLDHTADIEISTRRILWGKFLNAGQTCVAPDYLLCPKELQEEFIFHSKNIINEFFSDDPKTSPDFVRIVNEQQFERLRNLLRGCDIAVGGDIDPSDKYIAPTILVNVKATHPIMQEEIFGPILPILNVEDAMEAVNFLKNRTKPLAFYIFSRNKEDIRMLLERISSGGVTINDTIIHSTLCNLPFGGVGSSGMGAYHGKYTFDTFTHKKAVLHKRLGIIGEKILTLRYYPLSWEKENILRRVFVPLSYWPHKYWSLFIMFGLGIATGHIFGNFQDIVAHIECPF